MTRKSPTRIQWEQELAGWGPNNQAIFAETLAQRRQQFPNESEDWAWTATFRAVRDQLLRHGYMTLDSVPAWGQTGPARTDVQLTNLPRDESSERLERNRQLAEWRKRQAERDTEAA